jgi:transposase InsO family protein
MKAVAEVIGVSRSNLIERLRDRPKKRLGRPPLPDDELVADIKAVIAELPTYGYRRVHAILRRQALAAGRNPPNHKRVYRVMKVYGLLLDRHIGGVERRHDGRIAVNERNRRWCSDGFEIGCDNGEKVRVAFALDCCDREAMSFLATTGGISGEDVRDLMVTAVEYRFGRISRLPVTIEWLQTMAAATSLAIPAVSLATSVLNRGPRPSKVHRATEWPKHSYARSCVTTSTSVHARMHRDAPVVIVVRPLQRGSPAQGSRISFTP